MIYLVVGLAAVAVLFVIFLIRKKRHQPTQAKPVENHEIYDLSTYGSNKPQAYRAVLGLDKKDHAIRPEGYQQRNLDREVGGLEEGEKGVEIEQKEVAETHIDDAWDKRSEEVDKVGAIDPLAGHDKESMTWRLKKIKRDLGKHIGKR